MLRKIRKPVYLSGILAYVQDFLTHPDDLKGETRTELKTGMHEVKEESGWTAVKKIIEVDDYGEISHEAETILHVAGLSLFVGAIYGGVNASKLAYTEFIQNNQATTFANHFEAKKKLQDKVSLSFGRGAFKWSWRLSLFCTTFVTANTVIAKYRGKSGLLEYPLAGCFSGVVYKFNGGPRAWVAGGALGTVLGFIAGCATVGILQLTGVTMEDVRFWNYHLLRQRGKYMQDGISEYLAKEESDVYREHQKKVGEQLSLEQIDSGK